MLVVNPELMRKRIFDQKLLHIKSYTKLAQIEFENIDAAIEHFCQYGIFNNLDPNPLFSTSFYQEKYHHQIPSNVTAFEHYLFVGEQAYNDPHPLVDSQWVSIQLQKIDVKDSVLSALLHKCSHHSIEPNPCFSTKFYLESNPKLKTHRIHPLIHYLDTGSKQGLKTHPLFWPDWMTEQSRRATKITLLEYLRNKDLHPLPPNPYFDTKVFLENGHETEQMPPLSRYLREWRSESQSPNPHLDLNWFKAEFSKQLQITDRDPLSFVINQGVHNVPVSENFAKLKLLYPDARVNFAVGDGGRLRIAFFSHNLRFQGAQNSLFELVQDLKNRRLVEPIVFAPDDGPMKSAYESAGIRVEKFVLPINGLDDEKRYIKLYESFVNQIRSVNPDIVHCNTVQTYAGIAAARSLNVKTIWNIRESEDVETHTRYFKSCSKELFDAALKKTTRFVFVSDTTAQKFASALSNPQYDIVHNGINYNRLVSMSPLASRSYARAARGFSDTDLVFFNVGTWTERKGQIDILLALERLDRRLWPHIRILLIGSNTSSYTYEIGKVLSQLPKSLRARVRVEPETNSESERSSVIDAFLASDVFLFPSRIESYPRVVNEAMFFSLPIISTPCFGVIEQMRDGEEGIFYEPGNVDQLAKHMETMYVDEKARRNFSIKSGFAARFIVDQYEDMVQGYISSYQRALAS